MSENKDMLNEHHTQVKSRHILTDAEIREDDFIKFGDRIILQIPLDRIETEDQVRTVFDQEEIENLANDIVENGLQQPITVMKIPNEKDKYRLKLGERRYRAHRHLGKESIRCIVENLVDDDMEILLARLSENHQRVDLTPVEFATSVITIKNQMKLNAEDTAKKIGRISKGTVNRLSRIHALPKEEKDYITNQKFNYPKIENYWLKLPSEEREELIKKGTSSPEEHEKNQTSYNTEDGLRRFTNGTIRYKAKVYPKGDSYERLKKLLKDLDEFRPLLEKKIRELEKKSESR